MYKQQNVFVIDSDPQVLKGLTLLLEDMEFSVTSASQPNDLVKLQTTHSPGPVLLILPFELNDSKSGIELVKAFRVTFKHQIPAILLSHKNGFSPDRFVDENIVVLSDRIKPKDLRRNITAILEKTLAV